jgi:N-acetylglutamate synthase-like GNAT family acetyltransferase
MESERKNFLIRSARQADISHINELYASEYGAGYLSPLTTIEIENSSVFVPIAEVDGLVVGAARAVPFRGRESVYEMKGNVVDPKYQGNGIGKALLEERVRFVKEKTNARVLYAEAVCHVPKTQSQRNLKKRGFSLVGIVPLRFPDELVPPDDPSQPESVALALAYINQHKTGWSGRSIYAPKEYVDILKPLVQTQWPRKLFRAKEPMPSIKDVPSVYDSTTDRTGSSLVEVPINWKESLSAIDEYQKMGYLLAGVLPGVYQTPCEEPYDTLLMYLPPERYRINFDAIHVEQELRRFKNFSREEYGRRDG